MVLVEGRQRVHALPAGMNDSAFACAGGSAVACQDEAIVPEEAKHGMHMCRLNRLNRLNVYIPTCAVLQSSQPRTRLQGSAAPCPTKLGSLRGNV